MKLTGCIFPRILNNQLPENHKQDVRYLYDERGNRIKASYGNGIVQTRYQYDTQNQLIQLENITGVHTTQKLNFTYDALGRRCAKYVTTYSNNRPTSQYRIDFLWDGDVLLAEQKVELDITAEPDKHPKPSFNQPDAIYIHRPNSFEPLMQLRQPDPEDIPKEDFLPKPTYSVYYYLNDHLGTPQELLNKRGELVWQARTSPYGEILKLGTNKIPNPIRLPGQYEDSESGLYYNRFRYYSPQDGGYINRDPIGLLGGFNLYDYPRNPISWMDPFGLVGLNDTGYSVYALLDKGSNDPYYIGISNSPVLREQQHIKSGRLIEGSGKLEVLQSDLTYAQARGYEQAYIEEFKTKTGTIGEDISPTNKGNKINSFDKNRLDDRGKAFKSKYDDVIDDVKSDVKARSRCKCKG